MPPSCHVVKYVPKVPWEMNQTMGKQVISTFGALQVMLGQEGTEGLGFSMDAVPHGLPVPHFGKTRLGGTEEYLIPDRLLDIIAGVFYLIHGLYIVVINNGK